MKKEPGTGKESRQGVDAVEVTGAILQALLKGPRPARLKDLETATGIPGRQDPSLSGQHDPLRAGDAPRQWHALRLWPAARIRLVRLPRGITMWSQRWRPGWRNSAQRSGEVIGIAQWVGDGVTFVNWFESSPEFSIRLKPRHASEHHDIRNRQIIRGLSSA